MKIQRVRRVKQTQRKSDEPSKPLYYRVRRLDFRKINPLKHTHYGET